MTRKFSSYGPIDSQVHYCTPRQALIDEAYQQLVGENPTRGGHYITVWAPRQRGKTWIFQQVIQRIQTEGEFEVAILTLQSATGLTTVEAVLDELVSKLTRWFGRPFPKITQWRELQDLFSESYFRKPLILILDAFDSLFDELIAGFVTQFRDMYTQRVNQTNKLSAEKGNVLHGLALIGVRASLGINNDKGSPFNVQRSLPIPNLTLDEVLGMLHWYEQESGQTFAAGVKERLFYETQGQPGLVSWLGELLTETYNQHQPTLTMRDFEVMYSAALNALPNNNILNIISKAKQEFYRTVVLELFETNKKQAFAFDDPLLNFLYLNGVIEYETEITEQVNLYVKFPSPFVQKRLFNYFARELFRESGRLYGTFEDLSDTMTETQLFIKPLLGRYERYLQANREWLLRDAPRRKQDLRVYEAVYHFNLYMYLSQFLGRRGQVTPEFPTGNGKIDLFIHYQGERHGLEIKSFSDMFSYKEALKQAAQYANQLKLTEITLAMFVEAVDEINRQKYEVVYTDPLTQVKVIPVFIQTEG